MFPDATLESELIALVKTQVRTLDHGVFKS